MKSLMPAFLASILCVPGAFAREWTDSTGRHSNLDGAYLTTCVFFPSYPWYPRNSRFA